MTEVSTGRPPFSSIPHDERLALAICNGLRPGVAKGTPQCYIDLVDQCLDVDPEKRPSAYELKNIIYDLRLNKVFIDADKIIARKRFAKLWNLIYGLHNNNKVLGDEDGFPEININPKSIYTSRWMEFTNLSRPKNSTKVLSERGIIKNFFDLFIILDITTYL